MLIKSTLFTSSIFFMSCFANPKKMCLRQEKIQRDFFKKGEVMRKNFIW